jgi:glycosyltransferase involved in cell wall biosynthesis
MISVIIPTMNNERSLVPTLAMLVPGAMSGLVRDVTLADAGSTDDTAAIADAAGCNMLVSKSPLGPRLREAAASARGPWLMFLRSGTVLDTDWLDEIALFVAGANSDEGRRVDSSVHGLSGSSTLGIAAVFRRAASPRAASPFAAAVITRMAALTGRPHPDQGLLIATRLYGELGGHRDVADPEAELARRLGRRRIQVLRSAARR